MKGRWLYIVSLFLFGMLAFPSTAVKANVVNTSAKTILNAKVSTTNSQKQPAGNSPFIRFHHGISESGVSVSSQSQSIIPLKPVNSIPEKFAGIVEYISSVEYTIPVARVFLYLRPLRSPPLF